MIPHDVESDGEAKAGALVGILRGEEGVEDALLDLLGDARAIVTDPDLEARAFAAGLDADAPRATGERLPRWAEREVLGQKYQEPPRRTRPSPASGPVGSSAGDLP